MNFATANWNGMACFYEVHFFGRAEEWEMAVYDSCTVAIPLVDHLPKLSVVRRWSASPAGSMNRLVLNSVPLLDSLSGA